MFDYRIPLYKNNDLYLYYLFKSLDKYFQIPGVRQAQIGVTNLCRTDKIIMCNLDGFARAGNYKTGAGNRRINK